MGATKEMKQLLGIIAIILWLSACTSVPKVEPFEPVGNCRVDTLVTDWKLSSEEWAIVKLIDPDARDYSYYTASDLYIQTCTDTLYFENTAIIRKLVKYVGGYH